MKQSSDFALIHEMFETVDVVHAIDMSTIKHLGSLVSDKILLTGEGSSRIFPAKKAIYDAHKKGYTQTIITDGAYQSSEYNLQGYTSFVSSNSGRTKESIDFCHRHQGDNVIGLTATAGSMLTEVTKSCHIITCGKEQAVAATKSVVEQALFYDILFRSLNHQPDIDLAGLSQQIRHQLDHEIDSSIVDMIASSHQIYRSGRNNGVAEELVLKTSEITRKKSQFLEGTYLLHGIEEVMTADDCIIVIDPRLSEIEKITQNYGPIGTKIIFITSHTISGNIIPLTESEYAEYEQLALGRNILVSVGLSLGIDLDTPQRARKVGNEVAIG